MQHKVVSTLEQWEVYRTPTELGVIEGYREDVIICKNQEELQKALQSSTMYMQVDGAVKLTAEELEI